MRARTILFGAALALAAAPLSACGDSGKDPVKHASTSAIVPRGSLRAPAGSVSLRARVRYRVPPLLDPHNVYAADGRGDVSPLARHFRKLIYVPNSASNTVDEIDPATYRIVRQFPVGGLPQHVVPSYDLRTLWVTNDNGNSLTPINPISGRPGRAVPVADPYNMYFSPDGRYAMVMAERLRRIDFRDANTMKLHHSLEVPGCAGVNHADFTANGRYAFVSCEFAARMIVVDVARERLVKTVMMRRRFLAPGRKALARRPRLLRRRSHLWRGLEVQCPDVSQAGLRQDRRRRPWAVSQSRRSQPVHLQPQRRHRVGDQVPHRPRSPDLDDPWR